MNMIQQNEQFENPGMNINQNIIGNAMNQGMMTQMQRQIMQQMLILQNDHLGLGHQGEKPNFTKIEEDLSKLYDKDIKNIESIYNSICLILKYKEMIKNQDNKIKINFYGSVTEIKLYDNVYIWGLIEYIFDNIFGVTHAWICHERKYKYQTTQDIIIKPQLEIIQTRMNDYSDYLFLK